MLQPALSREPFWILAAVNHTLHQPLPSHIEGLARKTQLLQVINQRHHVVASGLERQLLL